MGLKNKACVLVTVGAALGLGDHVIKSNLYALKTEWTAMVSSLLQTKLVQVDRPKKILKTGKEGHRAAEESLRIVVYLNCWEVPDISVGTKPRKIKDTWKFGDDCL